MPPGPPSYRSAGRPDRGTATIAVVLLVALAVVLAGIVGAVVLQPSVTAPPQAAFQVDADAGRVTLTHVEGDAVDVRRLTVRVLVDGEPLTHQPPVPFFAAEGFHGGPTGPFNSAADPGWEPGESASFRVASTNAPALAAGSAVTVVLSVRGHVVWRGTTTV